VLDILKGYTSDAAYCAFAEDHLGRLLPGYWADIMVLGGDIVSMDPAAIVAVLVAATVPGGQVVFQA